MPVLLGLQRLELAKREPCCEEELERAILRLTMAQCAETELVLRTARGARNSIS